MNNRPVSSTFPVSRHMGRVALVLTGLLAMPCMAQAGFQWVAPGSDQAVASSSGTSSGATALSAPTASAPSSTSGRAAPSSSVESQHVLVAPASARAAAAEAEAPVVIEGSVDAASKAAAALPTAPAPAEAGLAARDGAVRGFADNVPLSVALRQVLPSDVGFSAAQDVNLATLVSWKGSSSWRQTLANMLQPAGLSMREQGQVIQIVRAQGVSQTQDMAPAAARPALLYATDDQAPTSKPLAIAPSAGADLAPAPLASASNEKSLPAVSVPDRSHEQGVLGVLPNEKGAPSASADASAPLLQGGVIDTWSGERGDTLHKVLESWSHRANVEISWQTEYDYPLQASVALTGTFEEVVRGLLSGFQDARPQPVATLHNGQTAGQMVLVVRARGNNYSD